MEAKSPSRSNWYDLVWELWRPYSSGEEEELADRIDTVEEVNNEHMPHLL